MEQTPKDSTERRGYRKSPGRQYGYEYDPLHSRSGREAQGDGPTRSGRLASRGTNNGMNNTRSESLTQRPDPRRTRQLLRQNILASKVRSSDDPQDQEEEFYEETPSPSPRYTQRHLSQSGQVSRSHSALSRAPEIFEEEEEDQYAYADPDLGYEEEMEEETDPLDFRLSQRGSHLTSRLDQESADLSRLPARASRNVRPEYEALDDGYDEYEDELYAEEEESPRQPRKKKRGVTRRRLLFGLGAAAVGGTAVAAYELGPKLPQAIGNVGTDIEKQVQDAFNRGVAQGADAVRKEFITSLESLEGVSLDAASEAAKLTRVAYDVFVSPVVKISSQITGDVLNGMLAAFKVGRDWLGRINQDNVTLAAIQTVLESWVKQVQQLPKQLETITQADLGGAQAYLRSLQVKLDAEKAKLNSPQGTPTPIPNPTPQATPKTK